MTQNYLATVPADTDNSGSDKGGLLVQGRPELHNEFATQNNLMKL